MENIRNQVDTTLCTVDTQIRDVGSAAELEGWDDINEEPARNSHD